MALRETELSPQRKERKEQEVTRRGVVAVLAHRNVETQKASVFVLEHNANPRKGIKEGDLGLPCETCEPGEAPTQTANRLYVEEIGIKSEDIQAFVQKGHEYLRLTLPVPRIEADIVVLWVSEQKQLKEAHPEDKTEIKRGFFLPVEQLFEDPKLQLRKDLNPTWFLKPLVEGEFLSPNGGYDPARLDEIIPLRPIQR